MGVISKNFKDFDKKINSSVNHQGLDPVPHASEDVLNSERGMSHGVLSEVGTSESRLGMGLSWNHWLIMRRTELRGLVRDFTSRSKCDTNMLLC